jgi:hypothetical protein
LILTQVLDRPAEVQGRGSDFYCGANKRQGEGTCRLRAGLGTDHKGYGRCKLHGGSTRNQRTAVQAQVIEAKARTMFGQVFDDTPVGNPLDVFAELAGTVRGWMRTMQALVEKLGTPGYAALTGEQVKAEVQLFERAMDRANTVLSTYAKLNIDDRLARISEAQSFMVMQAIESALAAAGVTGSRAIEAKRAAAKRLRVIEGSAAATP